MFTYQNEARWLHGLGPPYSQLATPWGTGHAHLASPVRTQGSWGSPAGGRSCHVTSPPVAASGSRSVGCEGSAALGWPTIEEHHK